ncbi:MAG TPA: hypothetical protein VGK33_05840 [Chloroflexota bacterium]
MFLGWLRRKRTANRQAEALVRHVLSQDEQAQLRRDGFLEVPSQEVSGRTYRIPRRGSPVAVLEPDGHVKYLCLQPETPVAGPELMVVHKLMLEGAEGDYWEKANRVGRPMGRGFGRRLLG